MQNELPENHTIDFTDVDGDDQCDLNDRFLGYTWIAVWPLFHAYLGLWNRWCG